VRQLVVFEKNLLKAKIKEKINNMADGRRSLHNAELHGLF
jgi:hypothetical protein